MVAGSVSWLSMPTTLLEAIRRLIGGSPERIIDLLVEVRALSKCCPRFAATRAGIILDPAWVWREVARLFDGPNNVPIAHRIVLRDANERIIADAGSLSRPVRNIGGQRAG